MKKVLVAIISVIIGLALCFGFNAGIVALLVWGLKGLGITSLFGWTVAFSWKAVIVFTIVFGILRSIFSSKAKSSDK